MQCKRKRGAEEKNEREVAWQTEDIYFMASEREWP
jgi:hypothetical protein